MAWLCLNCDGRICLLNIRHFTDACVVNALFKAIFKHSRAVRMQSARREERRWICCLHLVGVLHFRCISFMFWSAWKCAFLSIFMLLLALWSQFVCVVGYNCIHMNVLFMHMWFPHAVACLDYICACVCFFARIKAIYAVTTTGVATQGRHLRTSFWFSHGFMTFWLIRIPWSACLDICADPRPAMLWSLLRTSTTHRHLQEEPFLHSITTVQAIWLSQDVRRVCSISASIDAYMYHNTPSLSSFFA